MTTTTNLILTIIIFLIIVIIKLIEIKKQQNVIKQELYQRVSKLINIFYVLSLFLFILLFIINLIPLGNKPSHYQVISAIINSLSVALLAFPLTIQNLYINNFKDEEKYSHIKTIITNKISETLLTKYQSANINIILISEKDNKLDLKIINEQKIKRSSLTNNLQIKSSNLEILDKYLGNTTIKKLNNLEELYNKIITSRGKHDNYIRTIKYIIKTYLPIILSYLFLNIMEFPVVYNILLVAILKLLTTIISKYIYLKLPYDKDISKMIVKPVNKIFGNQELLITIIESFIIFFFLTIPYMFILAQGGGLPFVYTIYIVSLIMINILQTYESLSDSPIIVNIFRNIFNIRLIIMIIISIIFIIILNQTRYFDTRNITLRNNLGCLIISIVAILPFEIFKLARFFTEKGHKKHAIKNN